MSDADADADAEARFAARALAFGRDVHSGHGKIEILPKVTVGSLAELAVAYTPGVGHVVRHVIEHPEELARQTARETMIALVTDGTAVLGFGDVGPRAAIPVMEGKAVMFKALAGLDCMPLCLAAAGVDAFCDAVAALEPSFAGVNIEDVAAPHCFEIVARLERRLGIPVLHDDQFGTATVVAAAMTNALALTGRRPAEARVAVLGIGAAGTATITMLRALGVGDIVAVDRQGILAGGPQEPVHWRSVAAATNPRGLRGDLAAALAGADAVVGLSAAGLIRPEMIRAMAPEPIVFALANPRPEIDPPEAVAAGAAVVASGRFDFPNHCNNVLAFPGLMRGAVATAARRITPEMCLAAARAIAGFPSGGAPRRDRLLPSPLDPGLHAAVAEATARAAVEAGLARRVPAEGAVAAETRAAAEAVARRTAAAIGAGGPGARAALADAAGN